MITEPTVRLLGSFRLSHECEDVMDFDPQTTDGDAAAVFAGRACYQSFDRTYAPTADDGDYLNRTVHAQEHLSVIEHGSAAFYITGVSRSLTHELVRHRHFGYSQLSQRYVDSTEMDWVCPIEYLDDQEAQESVQELFSAALSTYEDLVSRTMARALDGDRMTTQPERTHARKRARQSARSVLPNCTETRLVLSGNYRAWLEAMAKRDAPGAEPEIRRLFREYLLPRLHDLAPHIFA